MTSRHDSRRAARREHSRRLLASSLDVKAPACAHSASRAEPCGAAAPGGRVTIGRSRSRARFRLKHLRRERLATWGGFGPRLRLRAGGAAGEHERGVHPARRAPHVDFSSRRPGDAASLAEPVRTPRTSPAPSCPTLRPCARRPSLSGTPRPWPPPLRHRKVASRVRRSLLSADPAWARSAAPRSSASCRRPRTTSRVRRLWAVDDPHPASPTCPLAPGADDDAAPPLRSVAGLDVAPTVTTRSSGGGLEPERQACGLTPRGLAHFVLRPATALPASAGRDASGAPLGPRHRPTGSFGRAGPSSGAARGERHSRCLSSPPMSRPGSCPALACRWHRRLRCRNDPRARHAVPEPPSAAETAAARRFRPDAKDGAALQAQ